MAFNSGFSSGLRGLFTNNPVNKVGPTGQPLIGGSNITDLLTRGAGGLLGRDVRSPEEKILAAQQGIDTSTDQGLLQSIDARLRFEKDPGQRASLENQKSIVRGRIAAAARQTKEDETTASVNAMVEPLLRNSGQEELADLALKNALTSTDAMSLLKDFSADRKNITKAKGDFNSYIIQSPDFEGTEVAKQAQEGTLPVVPEKYMSQYITSLRTKVDIDRFISSLEGNEKVGNIVSDLKSGVIDLSGARKMYKEQQAGAKFSTVRYVQDASGNVIAVRDRTVKGQPPEVVTQLADGSYKVLPESSLSKVETPKSPKAAKGITKNDLDFAIVRLKNEYPQALDDYNDLDTGLKEDFKTQVAIRASEIAAQQGNIRDKFFYYNDALEELIPLIEVTTEKGMFWDTSTTSFKAPPPAKSSNRETTWGGE